MTMFQCQSCGGHAFKLVVQPDFQGRVDIYTNAREDVMIRVAGQEFVADLPFLNRFGACEACGATRQWAYFYPSAAQPFLARESAG